MFGQLRPAIKHLPAAERAHYARMYCHACGLTSAHLGYHARALLMHDVVSLVWLLVPAPDAATSPGRLNCVRLGSRRRVDRADRLGMLMAGASALMVRIKLDDDVRDGQAGRWRLFGRVVRSTSERAVSLLGQAGLEWERVLELVHRSDELECHAGLSVDDYAAPTAMAYGMLSTALVRNAQPTDESVVETAEEVGRLLGMLVYLVDAASDYEADRRQGRFNPLGLDASSATEALAAVIESLPHRIQQLKLAGQQQIRLQALLYRLIGRLEDHRQRLLAQTQFRDTGETHVALNVICCMPCGSGGVAVGGDDAGSVCGGLCCLGCGGYICCNWCA